MPSRIKVLLHALVDLAGQTYLNTSAQMAQPLLAEPATKISDHVLAIMGFPNVAIAIGERAEGSEM